MKLKNHMKNLILNKNSTIRTMFIKILVAYHNSKILFIIRYKPFMSDKAYLKWKYKKEFGIKPDLDNPKTFNEKNNWRKLHDRNPLYTKMADKYLNKKIIRERVGAEHTFPLLGVWNDPSDIDYDSLPNQFVLKANHAGGVIVCRNKEYFDREKAKKKLEGTLKFNYFPISREWPYKNIPRKIIAEQYMGENLTDYKNYCFNGKLLYTLVWKNHSREDGMKPSPYFCGMYDRNWAKTDMELDYNSLPNEIYDKPSCYEELVSVCEKMSQGIPFVRVDCYIINGRVYVGEMTFFPWGGFQKFKDNKWDNKLGDMEELPNIE